jgi:hypothetical protein
MTLSASSRSAAVAGIAFAFSQPRSIPTNGSRPGNSGTKSNRRRIA